MKLFLLMALVTAIEVFLIAKVGAAIGPWLTVFIIFFTAFLGSRLLSKQWRFVMGKLQNLQSNPSDAMLEALVLVISGVLLITPGFLTDCVGFLGLIPITRERFVQFLRKNSSKVMAGSQFSMYSSTGFSHQTQSTQRPHDDQIIEGEFERKD